MANLCFCRYLCIYMTTRFVAIVVLVALISECAAQNYTTPSADNVITTDANRGTSGIPTTTPITSIQSDIGSTEVNGGRMSSAGDCVLDIQPDIVSDFQDMLLESASLVYFKLNFDGVSNVYHNSSEVIDPYTWVWAIEGKGQLLVTYPFDFQQLSLGTLSPGVQRISVDVALPEDQCFQQASDTDKQRILASYVTAIARAANASVMRSTELYQGKDFMVCLEKQLSGEEFDLIGVYAVPLCTYYVFQGSTVYDCWLGSEDASETDPSRISKHGWLGAIFALGFILALFSPLAASFFIRKNPPLQIDNDDTPYLALNSDLPLGLKYLLCYSYQDFAIVVAIRWFIYVVAFMIIPFIPFIVSYSLRREDFIRRMDVAFELLLGKGLVMFWFIIVNLIFLAIAMFLLGLYLYDDTFVPKNLEVKPADRRYFGFAFDLPKEDRVPELPGPPLRGFMFTMLYRTQMAINPAIWHFWFSPIWSFVYGRLGGRNDEGRYHGWRLVITLIIFVIVFPFALFPFFFFLLLNSVPLTYTITWTISKCFSNHVKAAEVAIAFMTMFLSLAVLFIFVAAFVYIAEILGYTFIGFVLNSDFAGPVVVVILTFAGYLISAATNFYDRYCSLLQKLIEKAEEVDKELAKTTPATNQDQEHENIIHDGRAPQTPDPETEAIHLEDRREFQPILHPVRKLIHYTNGTPLVSLNLYRAVIAKYQPIYIEVASVFLQLLVIGIVVAFGLATIIFVDSVSDLPATVEFFATVVVAGVVPTLLLILKSPARQECEDETKWRRLEDDLQHDITCESGEERLRE